jgi:hypothetical protein
VIEAFWHAFQWRVPSDESRILLEPVIDFSSDFAEVSRVEQARNAASDGGDPGKSAVSWGKSA